MGETLLLILYPPFGLVRHFLIKSDYISFKRIITTNNLSIHVIVLMVLSSQIIRLLRDPLSLSSMSRKLHTEVDENPNVRYASSNKMLYREDINY